MKALVRASDISFTSNLPPGQMAGVLSQHWCLPPCLSKVWGHPRDGPSGDYSEGERRNLKNELTRAAIFCLVKQFEGYFWVALKKAKDGGPAGCQFAETNSFLSSGLKIHPGYCCQCAEWSHRRSKFRKPREHLNIMGFLAHRDMWVFLKQPNNGFQLASLKYNGINV